MSKKAQLGPDSNVVAGIGLLGIAEWQQIQCFSDLCIFANPSTRAMMETAIEFKKGDTWDPRFDSVIADYGKLKADCELFETKVRMEMLAIAHDLCEYSTLSKTIYSRLSVWLYDFPLNGIGDGDWARKFDTLAKTEWGKKAGISPEADKLKGRFTKFIGQLHEEAKAKKKRVDDVSTNLETFETNLKTRETAFKQHKISFDASIAKYKEEIEVLQGKIKQCQMDIVREEKADYDKIMVLKTAPVYLIIPIFGPFIMAGILLSVGIATGVLRKQLDGLIGQARTLEQNMGKKVTQMTYTDTVASLVTATIREIELIKPEVKKLSQGWGAMANEMGLVVKYVSGSFTKAELEDWDSSGMNLENAASEWMNVYKKADMLRQFSSLGVKCETSLPAAIETGKENAAKIAEKIA